MIPEHFHEIYQLIMEVKEPQVESVPNSSRNVNTHISKSKSQPKEHFAPAKTACEIELHRRNGMAKKTINQQKKTEKT